MLPSLYKNIILQKENTVHLFKNTYTSNSKGSLIKLLVLIHFMHSLIIRLAHVDHADVYKDNISLLNLVLETILCHIHVVKFFGEIAFAK